MQFRILIITCTFHTVFIAEEGPECFADQKDALIDCVNGTMSGYLRDDSTPAASEGLPKLVMGKKQCE